MSSISSYRTILLPNLKFKTNHIQRCKIESLKHSKDNPCRPIDYIPMQPYTEKDIELEENGYKIVRNVFKDKNHLKFLHRLTDAYDVNMFEFADKDNLFKHIIEPLLKEEDFINEYRKVYGGPFLWQKTTIHRKKPKSQIAYCEEHLQEFNKESITTEHMDITETPNSPLTITAYIAISDQYTYNASKLLIYPKSHLEDIRIPTINFDYVSSVSSLPNHEHQSLFCQINSMVERSPELEWVRECFYHLVVLDPPEYKILKSTLLLMLFNPSLFKIEPISIELHQGDVLFFLSSVLHGSTPHDDELASRVSLAVRGGYPYYEKSTLISNYVGDYFYHNQSKPKKTGHFLFSGTPEMIADISNKDDFDDIIYEL